MAIKTNLGTIKINDGKEVLIKEVLRMLPYTTVTLLGPAGTGKTSIVEEIAEKAGYIDELAILRLQGLSSEDFRMPMVVENQKTIKFNNSDKQLSFVNYEIPKTGKTVEFAKMGILKDICDNPDKNYLIFFDEITRASADIAPLLFELFERKIDGVFRPNMFVMTATNYEGDEYIKNIDFADPALRRRQIFVEYEPNKEDIVNFMSEKHYHPILLELVESLPYSNLIDYRLSNKELEQTTQLGSWAMLNNRWKHMEEKEGLLLDYRAAKEDVTLFGTYMFNDVTQAELMNKLTLFEQINTIDLHNEIIVNQGLNTPGYIMHDKKGKVYDYQNQRTELLIRTKCFIKDKTLKDFKYLEDNAKNITLLFEGKPEMLVSFFNDMNNAFRRECKALYKENENKINEEYNKLQMRLIKVFSTIRSKYASDPKIAKIFKNFAEGLSLKNIAA